MIKYFEKIGSEDDLCYVEEQVGENERGVLTKEAIEYIISHMEWAYNGEGAVYFCSLGANEFIVMVVNFINYGDAGWGLQVIPYTNKKKIRKLKKKKRNLDSFLYQFINAILIRSGMVGLYQIVTICFKDDKYSQQLFQEFKNHTAIILDGQKEGDTTSKMQFAFQYIPCYPSKQELFEEFAQILKDTERIHKGSEEIKCNLLNDVMVNRGDNKLKELSEKTGALPNRIELDVCI